MAQFIKVGERFINMDKVEWVVPRDNGELKVGLGEGGLYLSGKEAEEMARWLARNAPALDHQRPVCSVWRVDVDR